MPQKATVIDLLKWWLSKHGFGDLRAVQPVSSTDASLLGVRATPMLVAAALGQLGICESLVEHGAQGDVCSKCNFDRTCLAYACKGECRPLGTHKIFKKVVKLFHFDRWSPRSC